LEKDQVVDPQTLNDAIEVFYEMTTKRTNNLFSKDMQKTVLSQDSLPDRSVGRERGQSLEFYHHTDVIL
jgi:hypothetical protein